MEISTVGWRQKGIKWVYDFATMIDQKGGLKDVLEAEGPNAPHILLDCRPLKSDATRKIIGHVGFHTEIIKHVVEHNLHSRLAWEACPMV